MPNSTGNFVVPAELEDETDAGAAARRAAGDYFNHHARAEFDIPGVTFGARYDGSPHHRGGWNGATARCGECLSADRLSRRAGAACLA